MKIETPTQRKSTARVGMWTLTLALLGCGGSGTQTAGDIGTTGTGATPPSTIAVGPVDGFGSVVVAGVRYDDTSATVVIADSDDSGAGLKLGMMVRVEGDVNADGVTGIAKRIDMSADARGPVSAVNAGNGRFEAMAVRVQTNTGTVFEGVKPDLSDLAINDNVQAHGLLSDTGDLIATRVQKRAACTSIACVYKTIGTVTTSSASQVTLDNGLTVIITSGTAINGLATPLPIGAIVRVKTTDVPVNKQVTALAISSAMAGGKTSGGADFKAGQLEGIVSNLTSSTMTVSGTPITLTGATVITPAGTLLANGQRVKIRAQWVSGTLQAVTVDIDTGGQSGSGYTFFGPITNFVSAADFQVKGQHVDASGANVRFDKGTIADLTDGRSVEVRGRIVGTALIADRVTFK